MEKGNKERKGIVGRRRGRKKQEKKDSRTLTFLRHWPRRGKRDQKRRHAQTRTLPL